MTPRDSSAPDAYLLSLVIPIYNEENRIVSTLTRLENYFSDRAMPVEVIFVNDGSADRTSQLLKQWMSDAMGLPGISLRKIDLETNHGKGYAVRTGVMAAQGERIFFSDADLSTPLEELPRFLNALETSHIAIASRNLPESKIPVPQPWHRILMGRIFHLCTRLLIRNIKDTQCGFKGFRREAALQLFSEQKIQGFSFDVEILYLAQRRGWEIEEVPIQWSDSRETKISAWKDPIRMLRDLARIWWIHRSSAPATHTILPIEKIP